jgi:hypothetical protein
LSQIFQGYFVLICKTVLRSNRNYYIATHPWKAAGHGKILSKMKDILKDAEWNSEYLNDEGQGLDGESLGDDSDY